MGRNRNSGLWKQGGFWHIDKQVLGQRIHESTGTSELKTAELMLARRVLNLSAQLWRDEHGLTWLESAPLIQLLPLHDARRPYPLSWKKQHRLLNALLQGHCRVIRGPAGNRGWLRSKINSSKNLPLL